ncbi:LysR family transcriptional regulator [Lichenifustis flavocetrariae]|uniref:LysR family transcriptional regulator n=1 Tax=Lichenifustis flavocetrariae TaxID=2949735 RepID=A0AA42CN33_9HYPH|nr:LysR family transcriptional regulator [Lichenifustis flavocetrariae]MCW6513128.1 LysR family transcriptional regulator [Lichenifustis flavocetrariae]
MLDRFMGLKVFGRVAALGSLSAAAREIGASPTMVSKHVGAIEDRLGVKLLHRTTRKVTLTEAGRRYLDSIERVLADLAEADAAAIAERLEVTGTLRLSAPVSFGVRELVPNLSDLFRLHPRLSIDIGLNDRMVDLVEEGWDMALRIGTVRDQTMTARRLAPCHMILAASPEYLAKHGTPRTSADLTSHNCLAYTLVQTLSLDRWIFGKDGQTAIAVRGNLRASNGDALVAAAVLGQGLIYQPTFLLSKDIEAGRLMPIKLDVSMLELPGVFAVYPANRKPPAKVRAVVDFLVERFQGTPPWERGLPVF